MNIAEKVFIDALSLGLKSIYEIEPDIICTGYDQSNDWTKKLKNFLAKKKFNVEFIKLKKYVEGISTSKSRK